MTPALDFPFVATSGGMPAEVARRVVACLRRMEGKKVVVSVREAKRSRSGRQNRYWWGCALPVIVKMFHDAGTAIDAETAHEFVKEHVWNLTATITDPSGTPRKVLRSSTTMDTAAWEDRMQQARAWAAGFGYVIPLPNETDY